jgi:hypothetical protein
LFESTIALAILVRVCINNNCVVVCAFSSDLNRLRYTFIHPLKICQKSFVFVKKQICHVPHIHFVNVNSMGACCSGDESHDAFLFDLMYGGETTMGGKKIDQFPWGVVVDGKPIFMHGRGAKGPPTANDNVTRRMPTGTIHAEMRYPRAERCFTEC